MRLLIAISMPFLCGCGGQASYEHVKYADSAPVAADETAPKSAILPDWREADLEGGRAPSVQTLGTFKTDADVAFAGAFVLEDPNASPPVVTVKMRTRNSQGRMVIFAAGNARAERDGDHCRYLVRMKAPVKPARYEVVLSTRLPNAKSNVELVLAEAEVEDK